MPIARAEVVREYEHDGPSRKLADAADPGLST